MDRSNTSRGWGTLTALAVVVVVVTSGLAQVGDIVDFARQWGQPGDQAGQFDALEAVAIDGEGRVYVADTGNHRVQVFNMDGEFLRQWGSLCDLESGDGCAGETGQGQFNAPEGIAYAPVTDTVYVADSGNDRIQGFSASGTFRFAWGENGSETGQFNLPVGVEVDGSGRVYVADVLNHRVQVFSPTGEFLRQWGTQGGETGQFQFPADLAFHNRRVYVSDNGNHRVQVFSPEGTFQTSFGTPCDLETGEGCDDEVGNGQFDMPFGITTDADGTVYVLDQANNRVQVFNSEGVYQGKWGNTCALHGLESDDIPEGAGCDSEDGRGEFLFPKGIAIAPEGQIVVADSDNHRIQVFEPR